MENENSLQKEIELYLEKENLDKEKIRNFFNDKLAEISRPRIYDFTKLMAYYRCAMMEIETKYNHLKIEDGKYENWKKAGYFNSGDKSKDPFCIVIPPPNVTGKLHLGHAIYSGYYYSL